MKIFNLIQRLVDARNERAERRQFEKWMQQFKAEIARCADDDSAEAEAECWEFKPEDNLYDWRECDPIYAAREALSYYSD